MTRLMSYTTPILVFTVSITVLTVSAELHQNTLVVDATDRENWTYINLTEGETVDIADPATSMTWDLGFKRTEVIINGGVSGPGKTGALALKMSSKPQQKATTFRTPTRSQHSRERTVGIPTRDLRITGFCQTPKFTFCR